MQKALQEMVPHICALPSTSPKTSGAGDDLVCVKQPISNAGMRELCDCIGQEDRPIVLRISVCSFLIQGDGSSSFPLKRLPGRACHLDQQKVQMLSKDFPTSLEHFVGHLVRSWCLTILQTPNLSGHLRQAGHVL